jgi:hypothetical protein
LKGASLALSHGLKTRAGTQVVLSAKERVNIPFSKKKSRVENGSAFFAYSNHD